MAKKLTKQGARQLTTDIDRIATVIQAEAESLGIPTHIATDYAKRCDIISDAIERQAGLDREAEASNGGWDPEDIGEEVAGPDVQEPDEPFMNQQFSQQENRELRERQQAGDLGQTVVPDEQAPTPGVQASFKGLIAALKAGDYDEARVARALDLAAGVVKEGKGKVPPEFLENQKGKKDDDGEEKEKDDDGKKASAVFDHGYNLFS
jgi:hypothetical protein